MANITITFPAEADLTLRAFPDEQYGVSLADWGTDAKEATQSAAPDKGKYTATLDDTYRYWAVFIGAGQPADWGLAEYLIDIENPGNSDWTTLEREQIRFRLGLNGDASEPIQPVTPPIIVPLPDSVELSTGYGVTRSGNGVVSPNVLFNFQLLDGPGVDGHLFKSDRFQISSDGDGVLIGTFLRSGQYAAWRNRASVKQVFTVPDTPTFALPELVG